MSRRMHRELLLQHLCVLLQLVILFQQLLISASILILIQQEKILFLLQSVLQILFGAALIVLQLLVSDRKFLSQFLDLALKLLILLFLLLSGSLFVLRKI